MNNDIAAQVRLLQTSMAETAKSCFSEADLDDLRCVIRLAVEFYDFVEHANDGSSNSSDLRYNSESIFSGIDSFCRVSSAYRILSGATASEIDSATFCEIPLSERLSEKFQEFVGASNFERKCRFLLDLFKLQIVVAAAAYD